GLARVCRKLSEIGLHHIPRRGHEVVEHPAGQTEPPFLEHRKGGKNAENRSSQRNQGEQGGKGQCARRLQAAILEKALPGEFEEREAALARSSGHGKLRNSHLPSVAQGRHPAKPDGAIPGTRCMNDVLILYYSRNGSTAQL